MRRGIELRFVARRVVRTHAAVGIRAALHQALLRRGIDPTAFDPWFFPSAAHYRSLLESAGFRVDSIGAYAKSLPD